MSSKWLNVWYSQSYKFLVGAMRLIRLLRVVTDISETTVRVRKIMLFEPLIRAASSEEQFALHQSLDYARRGFLEEPL
jgi:hypothetical protein